MGFLKLVDGIIGDNYPVPDRMLVHIEQVVKDYLINEMGGGIFKRLHMIYLRLKAGQQPCVVSLIH